MSSAQAARDLLLSGAIEQLGRIPGASNDTRLVTVADGDAVLRAVYKPTAGERPLHDFPLGSLAGREVACSVLAAHCPFVEVPPTVLREDLPSGPGSLQAYVESAGDPEDLVTVFAPDAVPAGWAPVLRAVTAEDEEVVVAHALTPALRGLALFDVITNNADRKASHALHGHYRPAPGVEPELFGIDNGLSFHVRPKLRTILWGFAEEPLTAGERDALGTLLAAQDELAAALAPVIAAAEIDALFERIAGLLVHGRIPGVPHTRTPIPWPPL